MRNPANDVQFVEIARSARAARSNYIPADLYAGLHARAYGPRLIRGAPVCNAPEDRATKEGDVAEVDAAQCESDVHANDARWSI